MARPSLADSLKASLSKGIHVETAERIQRGLQPVLDDPLLTPAIDVIAPTHIVEHPLNQPDVNTTKQPLNQAINQANKQTINQPSKQTGKQTINQTNKQAEQQSNNQSNQQYSQLSDKQSDNQTVEQSVKQPPGQSIGQAINQTIRSIPQPSSRQIWLPLNENQGRLLLFLYENGGGLTNMDIIVEETGIAYGTARAGINVLLREGYVTYKARHNGHSFRGFEYAMNNHLCSIYAARVRGEQNEQLNRQPLQQSSNQTIKQSIGQSGNQTNAVVSSYLSELKPTTTSDSTIIEDTLKDPELGYWRDKGVNSRQINNWSDEFQMPIEQVIQSLKYCRYEMIILNLEEEKQISNPTNWFYKVMQRSGIYPKPNGYKSLAEIRAEQMEQAAKEAAEARERQIAAQQELAFQRIMSEQDSKEYQALLDHVNEFAKEVGGKALEAALREAFNNTRKEIHHD